MELGWSHFRKTREEANLIWRNWNEFSVQVFCLTQNQMNSSVSLSHTESSEFKCFSDSRRIKWIQVFFWLTQNQMNSSVFLSHTESNEFKCFSVSHRIKWIQVFFWLTQNQMNSSVFLTHTESNEFKCFSVSHRIKWIQVFSASRRIKWIQVFFWLLQVFWLANLNKFKRFFCFYKFASFDYHWLIYLIGNIP